MKDIRKDAKDLREVFYTDPELNEEYEFPGFYAGERLELYNQYAIGDIVFVPRYKYNNGSDGYNHLFVIVDEDNRAVSMDKFCMLISSNLSKLKYKSNVLLKKDHMNNLNVDSIVKTDEIYKINKVDIDKKIGKIDIEIVNLYVKMYKGELNE